MVRQGKQVAGEALTHLVGVHPLHLLLHRRELRQRARQLAVRLRRGEGGQRPGEVKDHLMNPMTTSYMIELIECISLLTEQSNDLHLESDPVELARARRYSKSASVELCSRRSWWSNWSITSDFSSNLKLIRFGWHASLCWILFILTL